MTRDNNESLRRWFDRFSSRNVGVIGLMITAIFVVLVIVWAFREAPVRSVQLRITAGSEDGLRHAIAESLAGFSKAEGIRLELVPSDGSQASLRAVADNTTDLALVQGGLDPAEFPTVRQAAVLHIEPLHLLVRPELAREGLHGLSGRTVNVSTAGSGTNLLATEILKFVGIEPGRDCKVTTESYGELLKEDRETRSFPDAVFTVSSLPSPVAGQLIRDHGYQLLDLPVTEAFRINWRGDQPGSTDTHLLRRRVVATEIPAYTYSVNPPMPARPVSVPGTRLQLVAHESVPVEVVDRLVSVIYESSFASVSDPPLDADLLSASAEFPIHEGAESYIHRKSPIITERIVELTEQVLAIVGTCCGGLLFVWQAIAVSRRKRKDRQFLRCIGRVVAIEEQALQYEYNDSMTVDDLVRIQREVSEIKEEMIAEFERGDIDGAEALSSFMNHANDASETLTRLILHERSREES